MKLIVPFPAPCAPQNVKYSGNTQSAVLSWDASVFAKRYTVYNVSGADRVKLCSTTGLSCQLSNFDPSTTEVTASNAEGESNPSQDITGQTHCEKKTAALHKTGNDFYIHLINFSLSKPIFILSNSAVFTGV